MKIGIPKETMIGEARIALTPDACRSLVEDGHSVYVEKDAGLISGYSTDEYQNCGARMTESAGRLYSAAELIVKVKQPLASDLKYLNSGHTVFSYLHLAADPNLIRSLCDIGLCAIPFESVTDEDGHLPLLAPMSQVAGRISVIRGASLLFRNRGGRGVLLGGVDGADTGRVVVLGAGVAGRHAVAVAVALGAQVDVLDLDTGKLQALKTQHPSINTHLSTPVVVEQLCVQADLIIGAVLLAGRRAPVVLTQEIVKQMTPGSVIVDIAIDQGGCVEGIQKTTSEALCYISNGVIHSAVPNMPAAVARTASQSLSTAILPYVEALAADPEETALQQVLFNARAIYRGEVVDEVLRQELSGSV